MCWEGTCMQWGGGGASDVSSSNINVELAFSINSELCFYVWTEAASSASSGVTCTYRYTCRDQMCLIQSTVG